MTDPIADLLVRIQNAIQRGHEGVLVPATRLKVEILRVLKSEGFVKGYEPVAKEGHPVLQVELRYTADKDKQSTITGMRRISKPGHRVYVGKTEVPKVMGGLGVAVLTTSQGVMTDREARQNGVGGEVLCYVW